MVLFLLLENFLLEGKRFKLVAVFSLVAIRRIVEIKSFFVLVASELLIYSWSRRDAPMPTGALFSDYNRVLTIHNVQLAHEGTYRCTVTRQLGQETFGDLTIAIEGMSLRHHTDVILSFEMN